MIVCLAVILNLNSGIIEERLTYFRDCGRAGSYFESAQTKQAEWRILMIDYLGDVTDNIGHD